MASLGPLKWPPSGCDGKLDAMQGHVQDDPAVHRNNGLPAAISPYIADTLLEIANRSIRIPIQGIPHLFGGDDFSRTTDTKPDIMSRRGILTGACQGVYPSHPWNGGA